MLGRLLILMFGLATCIAGYFLTCGVWRYREVAAGVAWLDPRSFESITMVTIGTGTAYENPRHLGPSTAIGFGDRVVLVDAGRGVSEALRLAEIPVWQPDSVLLTSLLPENVVGLDDLLYTGWLASRERPLRLIGPAGTRELADGILRAHRSGSEAVRDELRLPPAGATFEVLEVADGWTETRDGLLIRAGATGTRPLPQLAYRFEANGRSIVVSGSGPDPDALVALAKGAYVLTVEAFHDQSVDVAIEAGAENPERLRREAELHLPLSALGDLANRAGVLAVVMTRLRPPPVFDQQLATAVEEKFSGRVAVAGDGDEFRP